MKVKKPNSYKNDQIPTTFFVLLDIHNLSCHLLLEENTIRTTRVFERETIRQSVHIKTAESRPFRAPSHAAREVKMREREGDNERGEYERERTT